MKRKRSVAKIVCAAVSTTLVAALFAGCASQGPVVPVEPTVHVSYFNSTVITPELVKFVAKVRIDNNMRGPLDFDKIDYTADLFGKQFFSGTFTGMNRTDAGDYQTVTVPFQIPMKEVMAKGVAILADGKVRVSFQGNVYPSVTTGLMPVPFRGTLEIPIPNVPTFSLEGTRGSILGTEFSAIIAVHNTNDFPMSVDRIDSYIDLNGQRYTLLHNRNEARIGPNGTGSVLLTMHNSVGKTLSFALNALTSQKNDFSVGGTIVFGTPYGYFYVPVSVEGVSN